MTSVGRSSVAALACAVLLATAAPVSVATHPGHGTMALVGTLMTVNAETVTLDVRDVGSGVVTRVVVGVGRDTKLRLKKETIASLVPWVGASVVATVDYEEAPDGKTVYYATKVQVTPSKTKR